MNVVNALSLLYPKYPKIRNPFALFYFFGRLFLTNDGDFSVYRRIAVRNFKRGQKA
jgi:hypothetical protein